MTALVEPVLPSCLGINGVRSNVEAKDSNTAGSNTAGLCEIGVSVRDDDDDSEIGAL